MLKHQHRKSFRNLRQNRYDFWSLFWVVEPFKGPFGLQMLSPVVSYPVLSIMINTSRTNLEPLRQIALCLIAYKSRRIKKPGCSSGARLSA
jgi:hypothetical protein